MPVYIPKTASRCNLCLDDCHSGGMGSGQDIITVGIGGCSVAKAPSVLRTTLGSCIGITLYDRTNKIGGLIHVMLPDNSKSKGRLTKFANSGIPNLVKCMVYEHAASRASLVAKIFGGARMFNVYSKALDIGNNNVVATLNALKLCGIRVENGKTGGTKGSQIAFHTNDGRITYKTIGGPPEVF